MNLSKRTLLISAIAVLVVGGLAGGVAIAALGDEDDPPVETIPVAADAPPATELDDATVDADDAPLTDREIDRATAAALEIAGGGTVTDLDRSDDLGEAYEVEVVGDRGEVDVALSAEFERVPNLRYDD